ncbi:MAG TPA: DUF4252 domain-containing protein [Thermoanaerobaculia bacterium]
MPTRQAPATLALVLVALTTSGCMTSASSLAPLRTEIEQQLPGARFDSEFQLKLGRMSLGLAKKVMSAVEEDEELAFLRDIHKIEVAVYRTEALPAARTAAFAMPQGRHLKKKGWMTAVESIADDSVTWVLFREHDERIRGILVVALDDDELVLVKLTGDIQGIFDKLMEENLLDVPGVIEADLEPEPGEPIATIEAN